MKITSRNTVYHITHDITYDITFNITSKTFASFKMICSITKSLQKIRTYCVILKPQNLAGLLLVPSLYGYFFLLVQLQICKLPSSSYIQIIFLEEYIVPKYILNLLKTISSWTAYSGRKTQIYILQETGFKYNVS